MVNGPSIMKGTQQGKRGGPISPLLPGPYFFLWGPSSRWNMALLPRQGLCDGFWPSVRSPSHPSLFTVSPPCPHAHFSKSPELNFHEEGRSGVEAQRGTKGGVVHRYLTVPGQCPPSLAGPPPDVAKGMHPPTCPLSSTTW